MIVVEHKVKIFSRFTTNIELAADKPVEVYIDQFSFDPKPKDVIRIIVLEEPLRDSWYRLVEDFPQYYDYVFTYDEVILANNPKARLFRGAEVWTWDYGDEEKRFAISTVVGGKNDPRMKGYALRHDLWRNQERIAVPREFYLSDSNKWKEADYNVGPVLYGSKAKMFACMFHVAIENTSVANYYSEKLLDCLYTRTVPIYYGCTNIDKYFNPVGILQVRNLDELIATANSVTPEMYESMKGAMEENHNAVKHTPPYDIQLKTRLIELLKTL